MNPASSLLLPPASSHAAGLFPMSSSGAGGVFSGHDASATSAATGAR
jgi:hypothetical protein